MTPQDKNDLANSLDMLAFRYIANETSPDERDAFERRLADDPAACEAVAAAVELSQALAIGLGETESRVVPVSLERRTNWLQPAAWMSAGAAACLVVVLMLQALNGPRGSHVVTKEDSSSDKLQAEARTDKLALVWSQMRHPEAAEDVNADSDSQAAETSDITVREKTNSNTMRTPSWIAAAVSGLSQPKTAREADDDVEEL